MKEKIQIGINESRLNGDTIRLNALKNILNEFVKFEKSGKPLTESDENKILLKMKSSLEDGINQFKAGNREDLAKNYENELKIVMEFIPKMPTDDEIAKCTEDCISNFLKSQNSTKPTISMKDMKTILSMVQEKYPMANGKIVSQVVKSKIGFYSL